MIEFQKIEASKHSLAIRKPLYGIATNDAWYVTSKIVNGKDTRCPAYRAWKNMLKRCYSSKSLQASPTYVDCTVCDEWMKFSNFAKWHEENYIEGYELDKDIKEKGSRVYSPETCLFVTRGVNTLLNDQQSRTGSYKTGVSLFKRDGNFKAQIAIDRKQTHIGYFKTPELARDAYIDAKNAEIKRKCEQHPEIAKYLVNHIIS
jgi:hypothetical protein